MMATILFFAGLGAIIAVLIAFRNSKIIFGIVAAMLVAFPFYDHYAYNSCEGGCNIRVDLLLIGPIFILALLLALRKSWLMYRNR